MKQKGAVLWEVLWAVVILVVLLASSQFSLTQYWSRRLKKLEQSKERYDGALNLK